MNEHFDPELVIDFEEEDILQNNMALMSRDFNIIPLNDVGGWKPATPKPTAAAPAVKPELTQQQKEEPKQEVKQETKQESKVPEYEGTMDLDAMSPENSGTPIQQPRIQEQAQTSEAVYHTVVAGENLYRIATKYNTTVDKILKLNNLKNADKIIEGQKIRVK